MRCSVHKIVWKIISNTLDERIPLMKIAAIITHFRHRSHANVILKKSFTPCLFNGRKVEPDCQVVSIHVDQHLKTDMAWR